MNDKTLAAIFLSAGGLGALLLAFLANNVYVRGISAFLVLVVVVACFAGLASTPAQTTRKTTAKRAHDNV